MNRIGNGRSSHKVMSGYGSRAMVVGRDGRRVCRIGDI